VAQTLLLRLMNIIIIVYLMLIFVKMTLDFRFELSEVSIQTMILLGTA